ncbi:ammonium transporter [Duganella sp. FT135W]|uniref:Ammonium transporter n=1 Tax=Duganella flavida TaxID=2692175 RepID=A0A6L8KGZ3_9BURK|nr:ammonium transporter [Duganella flavida]MYM26385.1 ammonium transporter [Duganella flavida]
MNKEVVGSLGWGVGILVVALCGRYAREHGYLDPDTVTRLVTSMIGLMVAWFGNRMPKAFVPYAWARKVRRVGGWSMALSGLIYAGLWAFAPIPVAVTGGCAAIITGIALTIGYCFLLRTKANAA